MQTSNKNKKSLSSPLLVSTDCSRFKSFYLSCRHIFRSSKSSAHSSVKPITNRSYSIPQNKTTHKKPISLSSTTDLNSQNCFRDGREAAKVYCKRVRQLELELIQINKWIDIEKSLRDCIDNRNGKHQDKLDRGRSSKDLIKTKLLRLANGSYIYVTNTSRPWGRMAMQISALKLVQADTRVNVLQVLHRMASMGANNLSCWLLESMPMSEVEYGQIQEMVSRGFEKGFMESIVSSSIKKMEILAMEGLSIQMGAKGRAEEMVVPEKRVGRGRECVILAMLIQMRDPEENFDGFGDIMIGLVEASVTEVEESGFHIEGVHVAGIWNGFRGFDQGIKNGRREVKDEENYIWSVSMRGSEGRNNCNRWKCIRNPNIAFDS